MSRPPLVLTTTDVAARENVPKATVAQWCRDGLIEPVQKVGQVWLIGSAYIPYVGANRPRPVPKSAYKPTGRPVGRPAGSKNRKPYPRGVKRPRKQSL